MRGLPAMKTETIDNPVKGPPSTYLVGDAQREAVADYLQVAYGEGYLTSEDHDDRTHKALRARTHADLSATVDNLPAHISRQVAGDPEIPVREKEPALQPPVGIRVARCLFIAFAVACICMWAVGGDSGNTPGDCAAAVLGVIAGISGLASLSLYND